MGAVFPLTLLFTAEGNLGNLSKMDKELDQLGMRLRLTGRDLMRMGGNLSKMFGGYLGKINDVMKGSLSWEAGLEDITWALEDVGYVLGETLAPILDIVVGLIESFADALSSSPLLQGIVILTIITLIIGYLIAQLMTITGTMNLYIGTVLIASRAHLGFGAGLKILATGMIFGQEASRNLIAQLRLQKSAETALTTSTSGLSSAQQWLAGDLADTGKSFGKGTGKKQKKGIAGIGTATEKTERSLGGMAKTAVGIGIGILSTAFSFMVLARMMEPIQDLFDAINDALEPFYDMLEGVIYGLIDWIEENPDLARGLILALVAVIPLIYAMQQLGVFSSIAGTITKALGGTMDKVTGPMTNASKATWQNTLAQAALVAAVALLIFSFTFFFSTLLGMGVNIWEAVGALAALIGLVLGFIVGLALVSKLMSGASTNMLIGVIAIILLVGAVILLTYAFTYFVGVMSQIPNGIAILWNLVGAIIGVFVTLAALALIMAAIAGPALIGAVVLLVLGAAVLLVGAGFFLMGAGIAMASEGLSKLLANVPGMFMLIPALFGIAAGFGLLALTALAAIIPFVLLAASLLALSFAIIALAAAFSMLTAIGLGNVATGMGQAIVGQMVPHLAAGGLVREGGMAVLHSGEEVQPASVTKKKDRGQSTPVIIQINAPIGSREIAESFAKDIEKIMDRKSKRST